MMRRREVPWVRLWVSLHNRNTLLDGTWTLRAGDFSRTEKGSLSATFPANL